MKDKNEALKDYKKMIVNSWTYERMTKEEKQRLFEMFDNVQTAEALKGSYSQRWEVLQALYNSFLLALGYCWNWREKNENAPF